jgi:hypothetical protein
MMPLIAWMIGSKPGRSPSGPVPPNALIETLLMCGLAALRDSWSMPSRCRTPAR